MIKLDNKEKIYNLLLGSGQKLTTSEVSEKTGINIKNISRYLKILENEGKIERKTKQVGKIRYVYITTRNESTIRNKNNTTRKHEIKPKSQPKSQFNGINITTRNESTIRNKNNTTRKHEIKPKSQPKSQFNGINITTRNESTIRNKNNTTRNAILLPLTINKIWNDVIDYSSDKKGKGYERITKILTSHDNNRNYQSGIIRDALEILIEMGRVK